jgi:hypothetical protein
MKMKNNNAGRAGLANLFAAVAASAVLAACGGGGGSAPAPAGTPAPTPTSAPAPAPAPAPYGADLQTTVNPPTYAAGTTEKGAWDRLNYARSTCGFGLVQQDARLDTSSAAHSYYLSQNSVDKSAFVQGHFENAADPYFYGNAPLDRVVKAGFTNGVDEILTQSAYVVGNTSPAPLTVGEILGAAYMQGLLETIYHQTGAMLGIRSGGVAAALSSAPYAPTAGTTFYVFSLVSDLSDEADAQKQKLGSGAMATYPCQGVTGVVGVFAPATESPAPFADVTSSSTKYGTPVYFKVDPGSVLSITTATITKTSDGTVLATRMLNKANDPNGELGANEAFMVPTTALSAASTYTVNITGTVDGAAIGRTFSFATAP